MNKFKRFIKNISDNIGFELVIIATLLGAYVLFIGAFYVISLLIAKLAHIDNQVAMFLTALGVIAGAIIYGIVKAILWVKHMWDIS